MEHEKEVVDRAILQLWLALFDLSSLGIEAISDENADLFSVIGKHSAVKSRLQKTTR